MNSWKIYAVLALSAGAFLSGWLVNGWRMDAKLVDAQQDVIDWQDEVDRLSRENAQLRAESDREAEVIEKEVIKEVVRYVEADGPNCRVPQLHELRNQANRELSGSGG